MELERVIAALAPQDVIGRARVDVTGLAYDAKDVHAGSLFFCVPGSRRDGHDFAADAVARGAVALVVERRLDVGVPQVVVEAGSVCVNEVLYTHGIGQTPWGGFKNSGRGRTHGTEGLMELVQPQHIHVNRVAILPDTWWMPYSSTAVQTFKKFATNFASGSLVKTNLMLPQLAQRIRELMTKKNK
jgi:UDP-N-acetylmuramyl pentapeptide synthase